VEKTRKIVRKVVVTSGILTLFFLALGILIIALSNGDVNKQHGGVFLTFPVFFTLCLLDAIGFLALLVMDILAKNKMRDVRLWPYLVVALVITAFLMLPVILTGSMWDFNSWL
jgi:hypothetical protein